MRAPAEHPRLKRPTAIGLASPDAVPMRRDTGPVRARYWSRGPARPAFPRSTAEHAEILANEGHERHETHEEAEEDVQPQRPQCAPRQRVRPAAGMAGRRAMAPTASQSQTFDRGRLCCGAVGVIAARERAGRTLSLFRVFRGSSCFRG